MTTDDGKRTEMVCTKITERMAVDLNRAIAHDDVTVSAFLFALVRRELYGRHAEQDDGNGQATK